MAGRRSSCPLRDNHEVITETLFPCDILPALVERGTLSADQADDIRSLQTRREQNRALIDVVLRAGPAAPGELIGLLREDYHHLHDHICEVEYSGKCMLKNEHKGLLIQRRTEFIRTIECQKAVTLMIAQGYMSIGMKDDILSHRTNQARVEAFLDRLATREDQAYLVFDNNLGRLAKDEPDDELADLWDVYIDTLRSKLGERIHEGVSKDSNVYSGLQLEAIFTPLTLQLEPKDDLHEQWLEFEDAEGPNNPQIDAQCMFEGREEWRDHPDPHCVLVKGPAGIGKTTMLLNLIRLWTEENIWTEDFDAVYLFQFRRLNNLLKDSIDSHRGIKLNVVDLLTKYHPPGYLDREKAKTMILDDTKRIMVCFDGLDEFRGFDNINVEDYPDITGDTEADLPCLLYNMFRGNVLKNARFMVTSRPTAATRLPVFQRIIEIQGFNERQRLDYVQKVCEAKASSHDSKFKKAFAAFLRMNPDQNRLTEAEFVTLRIHQYLKDHPNVFSLLYLPLLASFMCELLPRIILGKEQLTVETTTQVYVQCILLFARSRSRDPELVNKKPRTKMEILKIEQPNKTFRKLCKLAKWGVTSTPAKYVFYESELEDNGFEIDDVVDMSLGFLKHGMSQVDELFDLRDASLEFLHLTMQEFFAAVEFLITWPESDIREMILQPTGGKYEMVLLFMAGLLGDVACFDFVSSLASPDLELKTEIVSQREERLSWLFSALNESFEGNRLNKKEEKMARKRMLLLLFESQKQEATEYFIQKIVGNGELVLDSVKLSPSDLQAINYFLKQQDRLTQNGHTNSAQGTVQVRQCRFAVWNVALRWQTPVSLTRATNFPFLTTLTLDRSAIGPEGTRLLKPFLQSPTCKVEILNLRESNIGEDGALHLGDILRENKSLRHLFLTENKLSNSGIEHIACGLWSHPRLQKISLRQNGIGPIGAYYISEMLRHNRSLQILYLSYNEVGDEGIGHIMQCFTDGDNPSLVEIHLRCNGIGDIGAKKIAKYIDVDGKRDWSNLPAQKLSSLQYIRLNENHMGDEGIQAIVKALQTNIYVHVDGQGIEDVQLSHESQAPADIALALQKRSPRVLYLDQRNIGDDEMKEIAEALDGNQTLWRLSLKNNRIGHVGMGYLAHAMRDNMLIHEIHVPQNHIGDKGTGHLMKLVKKKTTDLVITMSQNNIGVYGAKHILTALRQMVPLKELYLADNILGDNGVYYLAEGLKASSSIRRLFLKNNRITDKGAKYIVDALRENSTIIQLDLSDNKLTDISANALVQLLNIEMCECSLQELNLVGNQISLEKCTEIQKFWEEPGRSKAKLKVMPWTKLSEKSDGDGSSWEKKFASLILIITFCLMVYELGSRFCQYYFYEQLGTN